MNKAKLKDSSLWSGKISRLSLYNSFSIEPCGCKRNERAFKHETTMVAWKLCLGCSTAGKKNVLGLVDKM